MYSYDQISDDNLNADSQPQARLPHQILLDFLGSPTSPNQNIVDQLTTDQLADLGRCVVDEYELDKQSRADWEKISDSAMKLAMQISEPKNFPFDKAANIKFPLLTTAALQFQARAYPAIVSGQNVVKGQINGPDPQGTQQAVATRIGQHMSYQILNEMDGWEEDMDRLLLTLPIVGCEFKKTYFDPACKKNASEVIMAKYVIFSHTTPYKKLRRITQELFLYSNEIKERISAGLFIDFDLGQPDEENGDEDGYYEFLECHRWYDLDGDGYQEPYIVTVHKKTQTVVRVLPRYMHDDIHVNPDLSIAYITPIEYWTKFSFIPNPDGGSYDIGLGALLNSIGDTVDTLLNQFVDAGTLANAGGGFIGKDLRMKGGPVRIKVGEYVPIDSSGKDIAANLYHHQFKGPLPVVMELIEFLINAGKDISSVKDILTGDAPQNTTATATMAMIEQGQKVFTAIYKRIHRALGEEFKKLYKLNGLYLQPQSYFRFEGSVQPILLQDYKSNTVVVPVSDPTMTTDAQKMAKAEILMKFSNDPFVNQLEIRKRFMSAMQIDNPEQLITQPKPPAPTPDQLAQLAETQRLDKEANARITKMQAETANLETNGILNLAKASSEHIQTKLDVFETHLNNIMQQISLLSGGMNGSANVSGMAPNVSDGGGNEVPGGLPSISNGGMGGGQLFSGNDGEVGNAGSGGDSQSPVLS